MDQPEEPQAALAADAAGPDGETSGGDPACWAALLCPACGAVVEQPGLESCARCGEPFPEE